MDIPAKQKPNYGKGVVELEDEIAKDEVLQRIKLAVRNKIAADKLDLPLLPHVAAKVLQLASSPNATFIQLEAIIKQDQMLAAQVLKIANSPFYRGIDTIVSIRQALNRIGMKQLRDLIFSVSVKSKVFRSKPEYQLLMQNLWVHSFGAAIACQTISKLVGIDSDYAFLCGLLHDIGKPILLNVFLELIAQESADEQKTELYLTDIFNTFHAQVGTLAASKWNLPKLVSETILYHHEFAKAKDAVQMTTVSHLGNLLCHHCGIGCPAEPVVLADQEPFYKLNITPDQIATLEGNFTAAYEKIKSTL